MAAKESQSEQLEKFSSFNPAEFAAIGKNYIDEFDKVQIDLFEKLQDINRQWLDRMNSEASLASKFASQMTSARSIPESMTACQEWTSRRFEMMAEDGKHLLDDAQKLAATSTRLFSNAWQSKSSSISS